MDDYTPTFKDTKIYRVPGKIKPYVRMTQRSKYVNKQAQEYLQWKTVYGWDIKTIRLKNDWHMIPGHVMIFLNLSYFIPKKRNPNFDLSNVLKGVEDALQGILFENDRQVEGFTAFRHWEAEKYLSVLKVSIL